MKVSIFWAFLRNYVELRSDICRSRNLTTLIELAHNIHNTVTGRKKLEQNIARFCNKKFSNFEHSIQTLLKMNPVWDMGEGDPSPPPPPTHKNNLKVFSSTINC